MFFFLVVSNKKRDFTLKDNVETIKNIDKPIF
jgi:hypothetical protein